MTNFELHHYNPALAWMANYKRNDNHAIADANRNLKGFSQHMANFLKRHPRDVAFRKAIERSLRK